MWYVQLRVKLCNLFNFTFHLMTRNVTWFGLVIPVVLNSITLFLLEWKTLHIEMLFFGLCCVMIPCTKKFIVYISSLLKEGLLESLFIYVTTIFTHYSITGFSKVHIFELNKWNTISPLNTKENPSSLLLQTLALFLELSDFATQQVK